MSISHKNLFYGNSGFTLFELLVTIAVLGIVTTFAVPSMRSLVERNQLTVATNEVMSDLFFVRSESLKRRFDVNLCPKNDEGNGCEENSSLSDYTRGWLVYVDCNDSGDYDGATQTCDNDGDGVAESAELLRVHDKFDTEKLMISTTSGFSSQVGYNMSGRARVAGNFCLSTLSGFSNKVIVAPTGRIRSEAVDSCN